MRAEPCAFEVFTRQFVRRQRPVDQRARLRCLLHHQVRIGQLEQQRRIVGLFQGEFRC